MKCHLCLRPLINGKYFSLECGYCFGCKLTFNKQGDPVWYYLESSYGGYEIIKHPKSQTQIRLRNKILATLDIDLTIENDIPQVDKLINRVKSLFIFT